MNLFDLVAKIILDTDDFDNGLDHARGAAEKFGGALKSGLATAAKVGAAAVTAATAAATAFAKSAIDVGMEFDASMSQVAATMGKSMDELNSEVATVELSTGTFTGTLREFAQEMGAKTAFSATEAASALNYMALAGYNAEQSMQALPNVLNLAAAGGIDLAAASDMVTDAQSALGLSMEESAELVDKMAMASSKSNTSVAQLGDAILTVGGTAKNLAGGTTEMATALGILADNGIKGAEGGTALRNIILSLGAPTDKAAEALESMGVKVYDAAGNMRPLNETFKDLDAALSTMTQGEQTQVLNTIFNKVDLKSVNALLANTGERFDELSGYIDDAAGSAQKMADTQLDNLKGDITLLKSAFEGLQITVSDRLMPVIRKIVQSITEFISNTDWNNIFDKIESFFNFVVDNGSTIISIIAGIGAGFATWKAVTLIQGIVTAIQALKLANEGATLSQLLLNAAMSANPIGIIVTAIAALTAGLIVLWNTNEDFREAVISVWDSLVSAISEAINSVISFFTETLPNAFSSLANTIKDTLANAISAVQNFAGRVGSFFTETIPSQIRKLGDWFNELPNKIAYSLGYGIGSVASFVKKTSELALEIGPKVIDTVTIFFSNLPEKASNFLNRTEEKFSNFIYNTSTNAERIGNDVIEKAVSYFKELPEKISNILTSAYDGVSQWGTDLIEWAKNVVPNFIESVVNFFSELPDKIIEVGRNLVSGLLEGIKESWDNFVDNVKNLFNNFVQGIKDALGIHSPSRVFAGIGENMALGLGAGWEDEFSSLKNRIENDMDFGTASIDFEQSGLAASNRSVVSSLLSGMQESGFTGDIVIDFTAEMEGDILARKLFRYNRAENSINGHSLVEGVSM